jgi:beta-lactam-binding protein with PASTA domain
MVTFLNKLVHFLKGKKFWTHFSLIFAMILVIVFGTLFYLDSLTHFGEKIPVPNFVADKVNISDLDQYLEGKQVNYEILDSVYRTDMPAGTVFFQEPGPTDSTGTYVKEGRKIKLRVTTNFQLVEMPQLAGKTSRRFAEATLINRKLRPVIEFTPSSEGRDQVMSQKYKGKEIEAGTRIPMGSKIVLIVSKGYSNNVVEVPSLVGLTISDAKMRLANQGLLLYTICSDCSETENPEAIIFNQSPTADEEGSQMSSGGTITVYASLSGVAE